MSLIVKNKIGEDGCINIEGSVGAPAQMFEIDAPDFWDNIEEGIKPIVKVLLDHKLTTINSCQGHYKKDSDQFAAAGYIEAANVRILVDDRLLNILSRAVEGYNNKDMSVADCSSFDQPGRRSAKILFTIPPTGIKGRELLNKLIADFSQYLDKFLANELK